MIKIVEETEKVKLAIVKASIIAAGYAAVTILIAPIAYGPIQVRLSDMLMPIPFLPYFGWSGVIGLALGTFIANLISPYGIWDVILGTLANFIGGIGSYYARRVNTGLLGRLLAVVIPIIVVTFLIGYVLLTLIYEVPVFIAVGGVLIGEIISVGIGGFMLITVLEKRLGGQ